MFNVVIESFSSSPIFSIRCPPPHPHDTSTHPELDVEPLRSCSLASQVHGRRGLSRIAKELAQHVVDAIRAGLAIVLVLTVLDR